MNISAPLVSVGIPTYNRVALLGRAVESVISQDYQNLEIIISDNASTDSTASVCADFTRSDDRVRYIRQEINCGSTANFLSVLTHARGELFMWLADDDWLDRSYISSCARVLLENPDYELACGRPKYYENGRPQVVEAESSLLDSAPSARVVSYYRQVGYNGTFYGLMRRERATKISLRHELAADWFFVAAVAYLGKVEVIEDACIHRSMNGASKNIQTLAFELGHRGGAAKNAMLVHDRIAQMVFKDIVWRSYVYRQLGVASRLKLGTQAFGAVFSKYCMPVYLRRLQEFLDTYAVGRAIQRLLDRYVIWRFRRR